MDINNLSLRDVADVLDAWSETEERKLPYLSGADKEHAQNCAKNFAWLRDQIRRAIAVCPSCGRERRTLILDTQSQTFSCFECKIGYDAPPLWVREPGQRLQLTALDIKFLLELKVLWGEQK